MTHFIRLRDLSTENPGLRLRLEQGRDYPDWIELALERTLPEKVHSENVNHVTEVAVIEFTVDDLAWLHGALGELLVADIAPHDPTGSPVIDAATYEAQRAADPDPRDDESGGTP